MGQLRLALRFALVLAPLLAAAMPGIVVLSWWMAGGPLDVLFDPANVNWLVFAALAGGLFGLGVSIQEGMNRGAVDYEDFQRWTRRGASGGRHEEQDEE